MNTDPEVKRHSFKGRRGQSLVEAAFVLPLFILILAGLLDFGWLLANQLMVNNGSRDGARYAIVNSDAADLTTLVTARVYQNPGLTVPEDVTVGVARVNSDLDIEVTVSKRVIVLTPIAGLFTQNQEITLQSSTIMRIE